MKKLFFIFFSVLLLAGCTVEASDNDKGSLVVSNRCYDNPDAEISAIYVKEKGSTGYVLVYSGAVKSDRSQFVELKPGEYSVKVEVTTNIIDGFSTVRYYDTGYNIYRKLKADGFVNVTFDGSGIYFE